MVSRNWIFVRGLVRGQGHWGDFLEMFAARFSQDRVQCLDLAGNGDRFREASFTDVRTFARDLRRRSTWYGRGKKVHLFGHSLAGMVAAHWADEYPEDIDTLYLMNTSHRRSSRPWERISLNVIKGIPRILLTPDPYARERQVLHLIANDEERIQKLLPRMAAYSAAHPVDPKNFVRQLMAAARCDFPKVPKVPTVLIGSRGDRLASVENTLKIASDWKISPRIHDWAGHDIAIDDPEWLLQQLQGDS